MDELSVVKKHERSEPYDGNLGHSGICRESERDAHGRGWCPVIDG
jgi:hypothetical protein